MTIEFNGRVVAGFLVGAMCGATVIGTMAMVSVGRMQRERNESAQKLQDITAERDRLLGVSQQMFRRINELTAQRSASPIASPAPVVPQDPAVQVLNAIRPGLGTAASALADAAKRDQARKQAIADQQAAAEQQAMARAIERQQTEQHCPSGHCAACPDGFKLFDGPIETYCVAVAQQ